MSSIWLPVMMALLQIEGELRDMFVVSHKEIKQKEKALAVWMAYYSPLFWLTFKPS